MSIVDQAKAELERINFGAEGTAAMVEILERFFKQWDSGGAVACVAPILMRCISGQPLSPLTGADDEWHDPMGDGLMLQNVRCGSVFKDYRNADGELAPGGTELIHDIDAPDPRAPITFPYDPTTRAPQMPVYKSLTCAPLLGCTVCGARVAEPCGSIEKAAECDLPPGTKFVVDIGQDEPLELVGRRILGVTEFQRVST
jgi:hypothetical protein